MLPPPFFSCAADWRKCTLFLGSRPTCAGCNWWFWASVPSSSVFVVLNILHFYSVQIIHPGIDLINGSMTHYIHVTHRFSIAHSGSPALSSVPNPPTDPRWRGIYGAVLRSTDSVRVHETYQWTNRASWILLSHTTYFNSALIFH